MAGSSEWGVAVVIGSRQGPGRALRSTQGAEVKGNPEISPHSPAYAPGRCHVRHHAEDACGSADITEAIAEVIAEVVTAALATGRGAAAFSAGFRGRGR